MTTIPRHRHTLIDLDVDSCRDILRRSDVATLVRVARGRPHVAVVNFGMDGDDVVAVRSMAGKRLAAALAGPGLPATLAVVDLDSGTRTGRSVLVEGNLVPVLNMVEAARLDQTQPPSWLLGDRGGMWLKLHVSSLTGRAVVVPDPE